MNNRSRTTWAAPANAASASPTVIGTRAAILELLPAWARGLPGIIAAEATHTAGGRPRSNPSSAAAHPSPLGGVLGVTPNPSGPPPMLDKPVDAAVHATQSDPAADLQSHLADLEARGLLVRIDRPIDKDTELHPLVRWQFLGGIPENKRRAFLFTNVTDCTGRRYDMPVAVGALAASPGIYAVGMGQPVANIGQAWMKAIANPIAPAEAASAPCQDVVVAGDDLRPPGCGLASLPVPVSTPGFDAAPYLTATLCITRDPDSGIQNMGMYRAALKATDRLAVRMAARPSGGAGGYYHWPKNRERCVPMPIAIVIGAAPVVVFASPQKLALAPDELAVAGGLAGAAVRIVKAKTVDLMVPAASEIVIEGFIDTERLEPEAPVGESNG